MRTIDPELLRTLIAVEETGSLIKAANQIGRTESAVSLQMKRLSDLIGGTLFRRSGRRLVLADDGYNVLLYARRILAMNDELLGLAQKRNLAGCLRIARSQDFGDHFLPALLRTLTRRYPDVKFEVQVEGGVNGLQALDRGDVDLVLTVGLQEHPAAKRLQRVHLEWIASPDFFADPELPVPLVLYNQPCRFKQQAIDALNKAGRSWQIVFGTPSLSGLWAAARASLGVTVRSSYWIPPGLAAVSSTQLKLPDLGDTDVTIHYFEHALSPELLEIAKFVERAVLLRPSQVIELAAPALALQ